MKSSIKQFKSIYRNMSHAMITSTDILLYIVYNGVLTNMSACEHISVEENSTLGGKIKNMDEIK